MYIWAAFIFYLCCRVEKHLGDDHDLELEPATVRYTTDTLWFRWQDSGKDEFLHTEASDRPKVK